MHYVLPCACPQCSTNLAVIQLGLHISLPAKGEGDLVECIYDIMGVEAMDEYSIFHIVESRYTGKMKRIVISRNLGAVIESSLLKGFKQVHRSFYINIVHITFHCTNHLKLRNLPDMVVPIGKNHKDNLLLELAYWRLPARQNS